MSTHLEALRQHRAIHADDPESRRVWLFHSHAYFDHGVPERVAEARAFMDSVIRTFRAARCAMTAFGQKQPVAATKKSIDRSPTNS